MPYNVKTGLVWLFAVTSCMEIAAQNKTQITIKAGSMVSDVLSPTEIYHYPQFTKGKVCFKDGSQVDASLNYSLLVDEMHFIDRKGDTLALTDENTVKLIAIDKDTFYYNHGYIRQVLRNEKVILAQKQAWTRGDIKKIGAYNMTSTAGAITSVSSYVGKAGHYNLLVNEDTDLNRIEYFVLGDQYHRFVSAGKKNLFQLFPKKEETIKKYLQENKIDFTKKDDMERLVAYLAGL